MTATGGNGARAIVDGDGTLRIEGALTFDTVPDVLRQSAEPIQRTGGAVRVDLQAVTRADSAGLALLVEWLHLARSKSRELTFVNVPEQLRSLIRVNGLEESLGVQA